MENRVEDLEKKLEEVTRLLKEDRRYPRRRRLPVWENDEAQWWRQRRRSSMEDWAPNVCAFFETMREEDDVVDADIDFSNNGERGGNDQPHAWLPPPKPPKPPDTEMIEEVKEKVLANRKVASQASCCEHNTRPTPQPPELPDLVTMAKGTTLVWMTVDPRWKKQQGEKVASKAAMKREETASMRDMLVLKVPAKRGRAPIEPVPYSTIGKQPQEAAAKQSQKAEILQMIVAFNHSTKLISFQLGEPPKLSYQWARKTATPTVTAAGRWKEQRSENELIEVVCGVWRTPAYLLPPTKPPDRYYCSATNEMAVEAGRPEMQKIEVAAPSHCSRSFEKLFEKKVKAHMLFGQGYSVLTLMDQAQSEFKIKSSSATEFYFLKLMDRAQTLEVINFQNLHEIYFSRKMGLVQLREEKRSNSLAVLEVMGQAQYDDRKGDLMRAEEIKLSLGFNQMDKAQMVRENGNKVWVIIKLDRTSLISNLWGEAHIAELFIQLHFKKIFTGNSTCCAENVPPFDTLGHFSIGILGIIIIQEVRFLGLISWLHLVVGQASAGQFNYANLVPFFGFCDIVIWVSKWGQQGFTDYLGMEDVKLGAGEKNQMQEKIEMSSSFMISITRPRGFELLDPGGYSYATTMLSSYFCMIWDPGGKPSSTLWFLFFTHHLEDKVILLGREY